MLDSWTKVIAAFKMSAQAREFSRMAFDSAADLIMMAFASARASFSTCKIKDYNMTWLFKIQTYHVYSEISSYVQSYVKSILTQGVMFEVIMLTPGLDWSWDTQSWFLSQNSVPWSKVDYITADDVPRARLALVVGKIEQI